MNRAQINETIKTLINTEFITADLARMVSDVLFDNWREEVDQHYLTVFEALKTPEGRGLMAALLTKEMAKHPIEYVVGRYYWAKRKPMMQLNNSFIVDPNKDPEDEPWEVIQYAETNNFQTMSGMKCHTNIFSIIEEPIETPDERT